MPKNPRATLNLTKSLLYEAFGTYFKLKTENIVGYRESNKGPPTWKETNVTLSHPHHLGKNLSIMHYKSLMAKKSLNVMEKMMDPNIIDYFIISCAIPLIITLKNRGKPAFWPAYI